jgi:hypothetical protein
MGSEKNSRQLTSSLMIFSVRTTLMTTPLSEILKYKKYDIHKCISNITFCGDNSDISDIP